ncbi:FAD-binding oxidoreductase [SAR202 cluster bacterium AD-804-J14_MRT_500m]|nr:FAD-binding oxidoreductase [SAR202 cluster bacterium AD-804-J14_MRT_500m]
MTNLSHYQSSHNLGKVAIIGGGVIGCFLAYRLSKEGVPVVIIERRGVASEASGWSAGNVQPATRTYGQFQIDMGAESLAAFRRWLPEIKEESGRDIRDQKIRYLYAAMNEDEVQDTQVFAQELSEAKLRVEWIDAKAARELDSRLSPGLLGGMLHSDCIQMDPYMFTNALAVASRHNGARLINDEAIGLEFLHDRITGVKLSGGDVVHCDTVVLAMGAWSGQAIKKWLNVSLPIGPHALQKLHLRPKGPRLGCAVRWMGTNMVHRSDGLMHLGSKHDDTGFDARPTNDGKEWLLERVHKIFPSLKFTIEEAGAGCGASTPGRVPILGPVGLADGVFVSVASTNGFLLSAFMSDVLTELLVHRHVHTLLPELTSDQAIRRSADPQLKDI